MKRLPEEERLRRGTAVLLTQEDKDALKQLARGRGVSQSTLLRELVLRELEKSRKQVESRASSARRSKQSSKQSQ